MIGNTDVSMWKEVLMKYNGENVYTTYHKVDDIPKIWSSDNIIVNLVYLQLDIVASRWFEINESHQ